MPEFLRLLAPQEARELLFHNLMQSNLGTEQLGTAAALDRVTAADLTAPHPLPEFARATVDGYALAAADTNGASDSLPAYLTLHGEVPMGAEPPFGLGKSECMLIHTGGMLPASADAVVMLEHTQISREAAPAVSRMPDAPTEIEVLRPVAVGENVIQIGEDVKTGQIVVRKGTLLRAAEIGGLMALGLTSLAVVRKPRVGLISSGDEVVSPDQQPGLGQVRDVNTYTLSSVIAKWGGMPVSYGIVRDQPALLEQAARRAISECDAVIVSAGSSASVRDQTASVIDALGAPGVLVHGVNTRPGKPTILGVCDGKAVVGLPGNPVSALVNAYLFVLPIMERLLGLPADRIRPSVHARLATNLSSESGREDWWPVALRRIAATSVAYSPGKHGDVDWVAEPVFGRSNLIFTLAAADGLLRIPAEMNGLSSGDVAEVFLL